MSHESNPVSEEELMTSETGPEEIKLFLENTQGGGHQTDSEGEKENEEKKETFELTSSPAKLPVENYSTPPIEGSFDYQILSEDLNNLEKPKTLQEEQEVIFNDSDTENEKEEKKDPMEEDELDTILDSEPDEKIKCSPSFSQEIVFQTTEDEKQEVEVQEEKQETKPKLLKRVKKVEEIVELSDSDDDNALRSLEEPHVYKKKPSLSKQMALTAERSRKAVLKTYQRKQNGLFASYKFLVTTTHSNEQILETIKDEGGEVLDVSNMSQDFDDRIIIIADQPRKTIKYLVGLALGVPLLTIDWIDDCVKKRKLIFPRNHHLLDCGTSFPIETDVSFCQTKRSPEKIIYQYNLDDEDDDAFFPKPMKRRLFYGKKIHFLDDDDDFKCLLKLSGATLTKTIERCDFVVTTLGIEYMSTMELQTSVKYQKMVLKHDYLYHCLVANSLFPVYKNFLLNSKELSGEKKMTKKSTPKKQTPKKRERDLEIEKPKEQTSKKQKISNDKSIILDQSIDDDDFSMPSNEKEIIDECLNTIKSKDIELCKKLKLKLQKEEENFKLLRERKLQEVEDCEKMIGMLNKYKLLMIKSKLKNY
eukprot:gene10011-2330_t